MKTEILEHCMAGAFDGTMTFGETVGHMDEAGVEWYSANLLIGGKTHYAADGSYFQLKWPEGGKLEIAQDWDASQVQAAIRASQRREINYPEFLTRVARAGVTYYTVHLIGRKAIYFGRHGDSHIELFPQ